MKPLIHARNSVKRYGGTVEDYLEVHNWLDSTKASTANFYHRAILHNTFGIFLCEQLFGVYVTNTDGKQVSVRDVAEDHVKEDCQGRIPTIDQWLGDLPPQDWMVGKGLRKHIMSIGMEAD
jgi:hypothetical protein